MRNPGGYSVIFDPENGAIENDTITCAHCQRVVIVPPRCDPSDLGGFCRVCMRHICGPCADVGGCVPFEKKLEAYEKANRFHRAVGTVLRVIPLVLILAGTASASELLLTWTDNSSDETYFLVERSTAPNGVFAEITQAAADSTSYRDTLLTAGGQYCYRVSACNTTCSSPTSIQCQRALTLPGGSEFR